VTDCTLFDEATIEAVRKALSTLARKQPVKPNRVCLDVLTNEYNRGRGTCPALTSEEVNLITKPWQDAGELAFIWAKRPFS